MITLIWESVTDYWSDVYANLTVQCKLHHDMIKKQLFEVADSRKRLLTFYDTMFTKSEFNNVNKKCFAKIISKSLRVKAKDKIQEDWKIAFW